jgi:ABC-type lipoprotein export system ATPase subunit
MHERLQIEQITKSYPAAGGSSVAILRGVSLAVAPGDTVAIVGPSGAGKSTLLHIAGALDQPSSGSVKLGETEVTALAGRELAAFRAGRVGFVFQDHHLLPQLTALENVLLPTLTVERRSDNAALARALLERVSVAGRADAFPAQMSGGERQRVAIARALINGAGLLLCDEPTGNLDHDTGAAIIDLFLELATGGVIVLMVTHNLELAARLGRVLALRDGLLVSAAPVAGGLK